MLHPSIMSFERSSLRKQSIQSCASLHQELITPSYWIITAWEVRGILFIYYIHIYWSDGCMNLVCCSERGVLEFNFDSKISLHYRDIRQWRTKVSTEGYRTEDPRRPWICGSRPIRHNSRCKYFSKSWKQLYIKPQVHIYIYKRLIVILGVIFLVGSFSSINSTYMYGLPQIHTTCMRYQMDSSRRWSKQ